MPDPYATISQVDPAVQKRLAGVLELRAADIQQQAMLRTYLSDIEFPNAARVLEVGCGTGAVTRALARWPGVAEVVGIDPSPVFLAKARELGKALTNASFEEADGRSAPFGDQSFDVAVYHTTLCHVPGPERALAEGFRLLRAGGWVAIFDGDYATTTVAVGDADPLQACADAAVAGLVHDRWLVRRLPMLVRSGGFDVVRIRSHGYVETSEPGYMLSLIDRGADLLVASGRIGAEFAATLKTEARRRAGSHEFFGHIAYFSLVGRRPA
jgi:ubiquinone/menaquinone biosynthesis C-methylase UbiE